MSAKDKREFKGTDRFSIQRHLGSGAFGVVYEVHDRERNSVVALKSLHDADPEDLYRFKQEFRALADVTHPNLVALYELISDNDQWFFTMELVEGMSFLYYVREKGYEEYEYHNRPAKTQAHPAAQSDKETIQKNKETAREKDTQSLGPEDLLTSSSASPPSTPPSPKKTLPPSPSNLERLRDALRQLAEGISALHNAGKLHCDIKPSNILVARNGRVVLLDFGMVTELFRLGFKRNVSAGGTPYYMSPEQGAGLPVNEASDWYSVGVMLYEALTGRLPFRGGSNSVLAAKQEFDPTPPSQVVSNIPEDLDSLCRRLLARDPEKRPTGREVLRLLGAGEGRQAAGAASSSFMRSARLVGRDRHLAELEKAYQTAKTRRPVAVHVKGPSGMGKSSLALHFLNDLQQREPEAVILMGRCYEQEAVPYKALDNLIDSLSQYLKSLSLPKAILLMPRNVPALARLFPVLLQVPAVASTQKGIKGIPEIPDSRELRRRAFTAFRELLERLAMKRPMALFIDDLQWGDLDSAALLGELLRPPDPPPLLLIASYRSDDVETSPFLRSFLSLSAGISSSIESVELTVEELSAEESKQLAMTLLGKERQISISRAETIVQEAGGSPFFIDELARYLDAGGEPARITGPLKTVPALKSTTLDHVIQERVSQLPIDARCLLEVLAVAGQPLKRALARQAAQMYGNLNTDQPGTIDEHKTVALLRAGRLARARGTEQGDHLIETYHDRIRETVLAHISAEALRSHHQHLAWVLESSKDADPERLMVHFQGAGELRKATEYAIKAAEQAARALAFEQAARLYRFALESGALGPGQEAEIRGLRIKLGDALANVGRGAEAAREYLTAAEGATAVETIELQRRAAEQFLITGHVDEGLPVIRAVLNKVGLKMPHTPGLSLLSLMLQRAVIRLRGLSYSERDASQIPIEELVRIDTCWSFMIGLWVVDIINATSFQTRFSILALRSGEKHRVVRAIACEACYYGIYGGRNKSRVDKLLEETTALAERANQPYEKAIALMAGVIVYYFRGCWKQAREMGEEGEEILSDHCTGVRWELNNTRIYLFESLFFMGDLKELSRRLPALIKEAQGRSDVYIEIYLRTLGAHRAFLAADEPQRVVPEAEQAIAKWSHQGFHFPHYWVVVVQAATALYCGEGVKAWRVMDEQWPALTGSFFQRIQLTYIYSLHMHAYGALAAAREGYQTDSLLKIASRDARSIEREKMAWADPLAQLIRAGIAMIRGNREEATGLLTTAESGFVSAGMALHAAASKRRLGELIGGSQGEALVEAADAWMLDQNIKNPARMTDMLVPRNRER
jgi:eukaryotic-like serine/threonine-protein kinase